MEKKLINNKVKLYNGKMSDITPDISEKLKHKYSNIEEIQKTACNKTEFMILLSKAAMKNKKLKSEIPYNLPPFLQWELKTGINDIFDAKIPKNDVFITEIRKWDVPMLGHLLKKGKTPVLISLFPNNAQIYGVIPNDLYGEVNQILSDKDSSKLPVITDFPNLQNFGKNVVYTYTEEKGDLIYQKINDDLYYIIDPLWGIMYTESPIK